MKVLSILLGLLVLTTATLASSQGWIVLRAMPASQSQALVSTHDVRAIFPDMLLLVGDSETFASLKKTFPAAILAGPYDPSASYIIIERPEFEASTVLEESSWSFQALEALQQAGLTVVHASPLRYLAAGAAPLSAASYGLFPAETEFVTVLKDKIVPIPRHALKALEATQVTRRADIAELISQVDPDSLTQFDLYLSGERSDSNLTTRNSFSTQVYHAANWIEDHFTASGFSVVQESFQSTYGPNVIATRRGLQYPNTYVIVGGHYDSRATNSGSGTQRAPGANDDGSGTSMLLEIARLISRNNLEFGYSIILGAWCGEEQGLVGSRAYAKKCRNQGVNIKAMLQGDMLAYRVPGERLQVAFPDRYHTPTLTAQVKNIINTYVPDIDACDTPACCSDQQSFYEQGYPATFFFERCGPLADNQYHREGDFVDRRGFDVEQWTLITQSIFASLLTLAEVV